MVTKSYSYKSHVDQNGKKHVEKNFSNKAQARGTDGNVITEKQNMYKNTKTGEKKIAKSRTLNDHGREMVRERDFQDNERVHNNYQGFDEEHADKFNDNWEREAQRMGFYNGVGNMLGYKEAPRPRVTTQDEMHYPKPRKSGTQTWSRESDDHDSQGNVRRQRTDTNTRGAQGLGLPVRTTAQPSEFVGRGGALGLGIPDVGTGTNVGGTQPRASNIRGNATGNTNTGLTTKNLGQGVYKNRNANANTIPMAG